MNDAAISIAGLTKRYKWGFLQMRQRLVLDDLSLVVPRGEVFGYLGPNGSGKTSTIKVLVGLIRPDKGSATVLGRALDDREWRARTGYLPENPYLYDYLTASEYLDYVGRLCGLQPALRREKARALLDRLGLTQARDVPLHRYSKGMLQRAGLAQALINDPELVILDEPMSGLDPLGRRLVRTLIQELKAEGRTVFFSTHILSDAETLCDSVALLRAGRLLAQGRLDQILQLSVSHLELLASALDGPALERLAGSATVEMAFGERVRLRVPEGHLADAVRAVEQAGGRILSVQPVRQSLEEFFFKELGDPAQGRQAWSGAD